MAAVPGTRLGAYEITGVIGAGGMGEVYRARDTKLGREVAIKTLPSALAQDPDRLARFEREAKLLAALNHAHIGAIYGLDEHEGIRFIAMELIEGQTLEEKLKDGALPVEDALRIALQIAEALEAAHEKGVVHRDLKPANVMLTRDSVVKVLDFGLAKAFAGNPNEASPAHSPALSLAMTKQGLILGTAGYMSPEQASGQATDQRADIWAFGVVLYEMLAGQPLFSGESVPHILADVLRTEPDWSRLPKRLHPRLKLMLERCLAKKPRNRLHAIADARVEIEVILRDPHEAISAAATAVESRSPVWRRLLPMAAAVIAAVVITGLGVRAAMQPAPQPVNRFDYDLPEGQVLRNTGRRVIALSPSGRYFAYNAVGGIYLRAMGELEPRLVAGTEPALNNPSFSPDGQSLVYWSTQAQALQRIAISGGAPVVIAAVANPTGVSWEADGTILFAGPDGIYRVPATGGSPELVVRGDGGAGGIYGPRLLPDGDTVLFSVATGQTGFDTAEIVAQSLATGERTVLVEGGSDARYLPTGHLVYALGDGLVAVAFDPESLTVSGGPVPLVQGVMRSAPYPAAANYDVARDGTLAYMTGLIADPQRALVWVDRAGREEPVGAPPRTYVKPQISPDGATVALDVRDQDLDLWTWDLARQTLTRLTFDPGEDEFPAWAPDGGRIAFSSSRGGNAQNTALYWQAADGTGQAEQLLDADGQIFPTSFLPDGTGILVYGTVASGNADDITVVRLEGEVQAVPLIATSFAESYPALSPDGRWLAYVSDESGREEIYVRPFPAVDAGRWQVSTDGGTQPLWARNGRELFYRRADAVIAVPIQTEPRFTAGTQQTLFEGDYVLGAVGGPNYDVSPDGERFLMIKDVESSLTTPRIIIVQHWLEELERLVPTG